MYATDTGPHAAIVPQYLITLVKAALRMHRTRGSGGLPWLCKRSSLCLALPVFPS